jgi:hypothetical protein
VEGPRTLSDVRFLRRSTTDAGSGAAPDADTATVSEAPASVRVGGKNVTASKGRATPKRRDAEGRRRGPAAPPPRTQREASKRAKANRPDAETRRKQAEERREGMARGDDRYLMPRDRGPVKAYVRDLVDSRPHLMGLFMPLAMVVVLSLLVPAVQIQQYLSLFSMIVLVCMITEGIILGYQVTKRTRAKFPDETVNALGTGWYAFTRASQLRRLRIPKPRVKRGATV